MVVLVTARADRRLAAGAAAPMLAWRRQAPLSGGHPAGNALRRVNRGAQKSGRMRNRGSIAPARWAPGGCCWAAGRRDRRRVNRSCAKVGSDAQPGFSRAPRCRPPKTSTASRPGVNLERGAGRTQCQLHGHLRGGSPSLPEAVTAVGRALASVLGVLAVTAGLLVASGPPGAATVSDACGPVAHVSHSSRGALKPRPPNHPKSFWLPCGNMVAPKPIRMTSKPRSTPRASSHRRCSYRESRIALLKRNRILRAPGP